MHNEVCDSWLTMKAMLVALVNLINQISCKTHHESLLLEVVMNADWGLKEG